MRVRIGDVRLFVEVLGRRLYDEGGRTMTRPTILFLHGGPAWDHRTLLADYEPLRDIAQLVFFDHRGLGHSDLGSPETWTLKQWAQDAADLIEVLGLDRPVVLGQSFGGMVAQQFAIDFPHACSGLVLCATAARFDLSAVTDSFQRLGGVQQAELARRFFTQASLAEREAFIRDGMPHYTRTRRDIGADIPFLPHILDHFFSEGGDGHRFDFRSQLGSVRVPALVLGGDADPVILPEAVREMGEAFPRGVAATHILEACGHGPARDQPDKALGLIRGFVGALERSAAEDPRRADT